MVQKFRVLWLKIRPCMIVNTDCIFLLVTVRRTVNAQSNLCFRSNLSNGLVLTDTVHSDQVSNVWVRWFAQNHVIESTCQAVHHSYSSSNSFVIESIPYFGSFISKWIYFSKKFVSLWVILSLCEFLSGSKLSFSHLVSNTSMKSVLSLVYFDISITTEELKYSLNIHSWTIWSNDAVQMEHLINRNSIISLKFPTYIISQQLDFARSNKMTGKLWIIFLEVSTNLLSEPYHNF